MADSTPRTQRNVCGPELFPPRSPGSLGKNDAGDPNAMCLRGDTPGSLGRNDAGAPDLSRAVCGPTSPASRQVCQAAEETPPQMCLAAPPRGDAELPDEESHGSLNLGAAGLPAVVRIPLPGTNLFIELAPRNFKGQSTSSLFIQTVDGKKHLRLDYGYNKVSGKVDYHWNQKGVNKIFNITDHTSVGTGGKLLFKGAKALRYGGKVLVVFGAAMDAYTIVTAKKKLRATISVAAGWAGAWGGCKLVGATCALYGTTVEPGGGTAVGGIVCCMVGGVAGYAGASWAAEEAYDFVEELIFEPLPEAPLPQEFLSLQ